MTSTRRRLIIACATGFILLSMSGGVALAASGPSDFRGHWFTSAGSFVVVTEDFTTGAFTATSDLGSGYTIADGRVSGDHYTFDVHFGSTYVSHNAGTFTATALKGHFDDTNGNSADYTATRAASPPATASTGAQPTAPTTSPPAAGGARHRRSSFTASLASIARVSTRPADLALSALVAFAVVALVVFPSELFNSTLNENYDEVKRWFGPLARAFDRTRNPIRAVPEWVAFLGFATITAILSGFLDPHFGADAASFALVIGVTASFVIVTVGFGYPLRSHMRVQYGDPGRLQIRPGTLLIAAGCVGVSRLVGFQPGYLYGALAGFAFLHQASTPELGRVSAKSAMVVLAVSLASWLAWTPVDHLAKHNHPNPVVLIFDALLGGIFVIGVESLVFGLIPIRFMEGEHLFAWHRGAWLALYALSVCVFAHVLLHPGVSYAVSTDTHDYLVALVLFGLYGLSSVAFWAYFRQRSNAGVASPPGVER